MKSDYIDILRLDLEIEESKTGVFYHKDDYASFSRRVIAGIIDIYVIIVFSTIFLIFTKLLNEQISFNSNFIILIDMAFIYLTFLKRSDLRTIGYYITGIKIVDLTGSKPSLYNMFLRIIIFIIGTYDYSKSIELLKTELTKQTFRDKYLGNYVIKVDAEPVGSGPIITVAKRYGIRQTLLYKKVENGKKKITKEPVPDKKVRDFDIPWGTIS